MAEPIGHVAMALLFALPAWMLWDGRTAAAFVAFVVATSTVPDVDLALRHVTAIEHHGVTHTVPFVLGVAVVGGVVATATLRPVLRRWWRLTEDETVQRGTVYLFVTGGLALGGLSHLFADVLAADRYQPIEPFWPVLQESYPVHVVHYTSPWLNLGLLVLATSLHGAVLASNAFPVEHRFRYWRRQLSSDGADS